MFRRLGIFVTHYRIPIIIAWIGLAIILSVIAPSLDEVATSDDRDFLPQNAPFAEAEALYKSKFPDESAPSSGVIVVDASQVGGIRGTEAWPFIEALYAWLVSEEAPENVVGVSAPTTDEISASSLISSNGQLALVLFGFSTTNANKETKEAVAKIDAWLDAHTPTRLAVYHTGEAAINIEADKTIAENFDQTLLITIVLVIVFLLAIYRSPVSPLVPLFVVTLALLVTMGILGFLGQAGILTIISDTQALLIVVIYGAGTDYCLFLINRFREEIGASSEVEVATQRTVHLVGETITSSAATIFVGFMAMGFSEMGFFKNSGPTMAVGIVVGLLAGLTLTPAILSLLGKWAFWPAKSTHRTGGRWYEFTSRFASSHPLQVILVIVALMLPFAIYGQTCDVTYNFLDNAPDNMESIKGYRLLEEHFQVGMMSPLTVVVTAPSADALAFDIVHVSDDLAAIKNVADVTSLNNPAGITADQSRNLLAVQTQLQIALDVVLESNADPELVVAWQDYLDELVSRFPSIASDPSLGQLQELLESDQIMTQQENLSAATQTLIEHFDTIEAAYLIPTAGESLFPSLAPLTANYIARDGLSFRMNVVISGRQGETSTFDTVHEIRRVLKNYGNAGVTGSVVVTTDIRDTVNRDLLRAFGFVLGGIFLVLLTMLRSAVAPLYLIGTVLLSYTFTLGVSNLVFDVLFGEQLYWVVEFMMFVFLVALGIDYSIFLFGRIKEEVGYHGIHEGVHQAVANTGAIITSAGMILAGTFAGLMVSDLRLLAQIGFSVAFGILVDTFVVRTILDPALAALFGRWTWWPGGVPKAQQVKTTSQTPAEVAAD